MNLLDLSELDLSGVAISAAIDADGALTCVDEEGMRDKVAAIRDSRLVRIHTLVVAADQQGLEGVGDNEHDGIHVVYAETLVLDTHPYPYLLHRAHELAVISKAEADAVEKMLLQKLDADGLSIGKRSSKQYHKDTM